MKAVWPEKRDSSLFSMQGEDLPRLIKAQFGVPWNTN